MTTEYNKNTYLQNMEDPFYDTNQIPDALKNDKYFILSACKRNFPSVLSFASETLKDDKELILHIAEHYNESLYYVSDRLKDDKDIVLAFLKKNSDNLEFVSDRLKTDIDVVNVLESNTKTESRKNKL